MSGTLGSIYNNVNFGLHLHSDAMMKLQEQVYSGSRINRASDDPSDAYKILTLTSQTKSLSSYMDNISEMMSLKEAASTIMEDVASVLTKTKVSLTQIVSGTYGEGDGGQSARQRVASEINDVLEQVVSSTNSKHLGQYLFGGGDTDSAPYEITRVDGKITGIAYQGSTQARQTEVASGVKAESFDVGQEVFGCNERGEPVFTGSSGAAAGAGTSNVKGNVWLTVTHDGSNYKLSIDDGATEVTVPGAGDISNIAVTNANGEVMYVDASGINSTGVEMVQIPGTYDVFSTLIGIRDLLENSRTLPEQTIVNLINKSTVSLKEVSDHLVEKQVSVGAKINFLDNLKDSIENVKFDTEDQASVIGDSDIAQIAIDISRREALYQMTLSVAGRLMSTSLLDFIR